MSDTVGWIGAGRMGLVLAGRLLAAGTPLAVYNRTTAKARSLADRGARIVERPVELASCRVVMSVVADGGALIDVTTGDDGLFTDPDRTPDVLVDFTTISEEHSQQVREAAERRGVAFLAAPVSGNPKVAAAGRLTVVVSGPERGFEQARPSLAALSSSATYVGEGDSARLVKICHNLLLGAVTQSLAEITVLAEKGGVSRRSLFEFLNASVMGSTFSRYKTPAFVNLDLTPTFTPSLLLKDLELGLAAGRESGVPLPVTETVAQLCGTLVAAGADDVDFAALLLQEAEAAGVHLVPDPEPVGDGLAAP
jgi:3-hydroxyisobutyrate dehydrogenase-like beta-hydroxyacid dehydrogenase